MAADLEENAEHFGFRGAKSYLSAGDSTTSSELVNIFYFQDHETCHRFAHSKTHMDAVTWWNATVKQYPHLGLCVGWKTSEQSFMNGGSADSERLNQHARAV